jgi:hypothetical protein
MRELITPAQRALMLVHGAQSAAGVDLDPHPVVKLFTPARACVWLLTELDPHDPDIAFGLCDLGMGFPELGSVSLSELIAVRGELVWVERDIHFVADAPLSVYAERARKLGAIDV